MQRSGNLGDGSKPVPEMLFNDPRRHAEILGQDGEEFDQAHGIEHIGEARIWVVVSRGLRAQALSQLAQPAQQVGGRIVDGVTHKSQGWGSDSEKKPSAMSQHMPG